MVIQICVFALITCFYGAYFYKQIQLKRKGISTNRLAKGRKPDKTRRIEAALLFVTYGAAVVQYVSVFFSQYLLPLGFAMFLRIIGVVLTGCGIIFFILATTTMKDNWRAGVDESQKTGIVTNGVYKHSRNPAFVGFDLLYIGTAFAMPNLFMIITAVIAVVLLHLQILEEEKYLPLVFGDEYDRFKKQTPRYLLFF